MAIQHQAGQSCLVAGEAQRLKNRCGDATSADGLPPAIDDSDLQQVAVQIDHTVHSPRVVRTVDRVQPRDRVSRARGRQHVLEVLDEPPSVALL